MRALKREQASLIDEHDRALAAKDEYYVAAHSGALAAKDEQHRAAVEESVALLNSKHEAVRSSLERRLKEDTEALAKRHAEELARDAEEDAVELEKAVNAAIKSQNEKQGLRALQVIEAASVISARYESFTRQVIEAELKRQESDFLVWHGDEIRRRRHTTGSRNSWDRSARAAANDQGKLAFRRTEGSAAAPAEPAVEVSQESPKKKGLFRRISKKATAASTQEEERVVVPARVARLAPDVLEAVLHHPPPAELGPAPRPAAREDVPEQVRDEQHAAAFHVAPQVVEGDPPELERARVGRLERGLAFRGRLLLVLVEHVLVAPRELLFQFEAIADREAPPILRTELREAVRGLSRDRVVDALGLEDDVECALLTEWQRIHHDQSKINARAFRRDARHGTVVEAECDEPDSAIRASVNGRRGAGAGAGVEDGLPPCPSYCFEIPARACRHEPVGKSVPRLPCSFRRSARPRPLNGPRPPPTGASRTCLRVGSAIVRVSRALG